MGRSEKGVFGPVDEDFPSEARDKIAAEIFGKKGVEDRTGEEGKVGEEVVDEVPKRS